MTCVRPSKGKEPKWAPFALPWRGSQNAKGVLGHVKIHRIRAPGAIIPCRSRRCRAPEAIIHCKLLCV
eukprot:3338647-Pyramimonas_sp.AAC.1